MAQGQVLHVVICADEALTAVEAGSTASDLNNLRNVKKVADLKDAFKKSVYSALAIEVVEVACEKGPEPKLPGSDADTDSNPTPTATPTPAPTAAPAPARHPVCGVAPSNGVIQGYPSYNRSRCGPTQWKEAADSSECTAVGRWKIADGEMLYICARGWYARWMASNR